MLTCEEILARAAELAKGRPVTQSNDVKIAKQILDRPREYIGSAEQHDTTGFEELPEVRECERAVSWPEDVGHVKLVLRAVTRWQQYIAIQRAKEQRLAAQAPASLSNVQLALSYAAPPAEKPLGDPPDPLPSHYAGDPLFIHADTPAAAALKNAFLDAGQRWWEAVAEAMAAVGYTERMITRLPGKSGGSGEIFAEFRRPDRPRSIVAWLTTAAIVPPTLRWGGYMHRHLPGVAAPLRPDEDGMCALRDDLVCVRARWKNAKTGEGGNLFLPALDSLGMAEALLREVVHDLDAADQVATLNGQIVHLTTPESARPPAQAKAVPAPEPAPEPAPARRRRAKAAEPAPTLDLAPAPPGPEPAPARRRRAKAAEPAPTPEPASARRPIPPPPNPSSPTPTPTPTKAAARKQEPPPEGKTVVQTRLL